MAPSNIFATFWIEGCENAAINGTHTVLGKVKTTSIEGATANFTHANTTAQETLGLDSLLNPTGVEGSLTIKGPEACGAATNPMTVATLAALRQGAGRRPAPVRQLVTGAPRPR